jgi:hypothetical protein
MSTLFRLLAVGCVLAALGLVLGGTFDGRPVDDRAGAPDLGALTPQVEPIAAGSTAALAPFGEPGATATSSGPVRFAGLPLDERRDVEVVMDSATRDRLTPRERDDQVRDWLLLAALSDAGLSADQFNRVTFDLPPTRHGHLRPIANFQYGKTRSAHLGDGDVVALVPAGSADPARRDHLAHVADEYRKTLAQMPRQLFVFEYEMPGADGTARLTRRATVPGTELFTAAYGYSSARIADLNDLTGFMAKVQDVTYARLTNEGLELGGRQLLSRVYRGLRIEDIAAVWKAQNALVRESSEFLTRQKRERDDLTAAWNRTLNEELDTVRKLHRPGLPAVRDPDEFVIPPGLGRRPDPLDAFRPRPKSDLDKMLEDLDRQKGRAGGNRFDPELERKLKAKQEEVQARYDAKLEQLLVKQQAEFQAQKFSDGTGFSLDPEYDYDGLAKWFNEKWNEPLVEAKLLTQREVDGVLAGLRAKNVRPFLEAQHKLMTSENLLAQLFGEQIKGEARKQYQYQAGRYDGPTPGSRFGLQGTEVGMTLFYTDLLAKLWQSVDYGSPKQAVPEFRAGPDGGIAPIYKQQTLDTPGTRIWFGKEDRGFVLANSKQDILFARCATRIFSASSSELSRDKEVPATQTSEATIGWWNDHYEEIAEYEGQYERLNEYMKWSLILGWLTDREKLAKLDFLDGVSVYRENWFPDWVKKSRDAGDELRFTAWDDPRLAFHPRNHLGTKTEAMKILFSRSFPNFGDPDSSWVVSGGVSGGRARDFAKLPALEPREVPGKSVMSGGVKVGTYRENGLTTLRGTDHAFEGGSARAKMTAVPSAPVEGPAGTVPGLRPQQATHAQLKPTGYERTTTVGAGVRLETTAKTSAGEIPLGEFVAAPTRQGFRVGNASRELDTALALGREMSGSGKSAVEFLTRSAMAERVIVEPGGSVLVQPVGSKNYYRFVPESKPTATVPAGFEARVSDTVANAKSYQVAVVTPETVLAKAQPGDYVHIPLGGSTAARDGALPPIRGPPLELAAGGGGKPPLPPNSRPVTFESPEGNFSGHFDGKGYWVKVGDLPQSWAKSPERLHDLAGAGPGAGDTVRAPGKRATHPSVELMAQGRVEEAFKALETRPEGLVEARAEHLRQNIETADRLLAAGRGADARTTVDVGLRVNPASPGLLFRHGLADLASGNPKKGIDALNKSLGDKPRRDATLLDEIGRKLGGTREPAEATRLADLARMTAARDLKVNGRTKAGVEFKAGTDGKPEIEVKLPTADARPAPPSELNAPNGRLYVEDAVRAEIGTGPAAAGRKTIAEGVAGGKYELFELHSPDPIMKVVPDRVSADRVKTPDGERTGTTFRPLQVYDGRPVGVTYNPATPGLSSNDDDTEVISMEDADDDAPGLPVKRKILVVVK